MLTSVCTFRAMDAQVLVIEVSHLLTRRSRFCCPPTLTAPHSLGLLVHPRPVRPHRRITHVVSSRANVKDYLAWEETDGITHFYSGKAADFA